MSASINTFAQNLTDYKWKNRILLVFGNEKNEELLEKQQAIFNAQKSELAERDLIVFMNPESRSMKKLCDETGFEVILIGKDSGVKKRKTELMSTNELFAIIDAMPMRRSEMRKN
ncbi:MAG: hypothetical protein ACI9V1_000466 [Spirosomataceae bacterium]|jgi:hypothetical protein